MPYTKAPYLRGIIGRSPAMAHVFRGIEEAILTDDPVLVLGETGTGKELIAAAIHMGSGRKGYVKENCTAIPTYLFESELFGHAKGGYTGATVDRQGLFLSADGGTIFLDEIGDLDLKLQPKLLRFVEELKVRPVGSDQRKDVNVRIVTATNHDLETMIKHGGFRRDLYQRLSSHLIYAPPLKDRKEDIPVLVQYFLVVYGQKYDVTVHKINDEMNKRLYHYSWPSNVRELEHVVRNAVVSARVSANTKGLKGQHLDLAELGVEHFRELEPRQQSQPPETTATIEVEKRRHLVYAGPHDHPYTVDEIRELGLKKISRIVARATEKDIISEVLQYARWNYARAAKILRISDRALFYKCKEMGIPNSRGRKGKK